MWWDDLEILRLIDQLEQGETGSLFSGFALLERATKGKNLDWTKEMASFSRELVLAANAGYITFKEQAWPNHRMPDPAADPSMWLQRIGEIRLTLDGRDRARGRFIIQTPPDPSEDDGRPIALTTLSEVARAISSEYTESQLRTFLIDSGLSESLVVQAPGTADGLLALLLALHDGGADARRQLRGFLGRWLSDRLLTGPTPELRDKLSKQLDRQGWQLRNDRLVTGVRVPLPTGSPPKGPEQAQICLSGHPINFRVKSQPELSKDFCPRCGKRTIKNCLFCSREISGDELVVDAYCKYCGNPFPWTDKREAS